MITSRSSRWFATGAAASLLALFAAPMPAQSVFDDPKPKVDCSKKANKTRPECRQSNHQAVRDEIYFAAYWLARSGQYQAALDVLRLGDQSDPRILNYTGFATRKSGDVDGALPYYARALAIDPGYTLARAYLGEAYLQKGDPEKARAQLDEIERRCGRACAEYVDLALQIDAYAKASVRG